MNPLGEFLRRQNDASRAAVVETLDISDWPVWVLDMCDAVDRIITLHAGDDPCRAPAEGGCETLRLLARPYRTDPEYRDEWLPIDQAPGQSGLTGDYGEDDGG